MNTRTMAMGRTATESSPAALSTILAHASTDASVRWWQWPHVLGLDAPVVAIVWQDWWGRFVHEAPAPAQRTILGLGVWLIYLADRLADNTHAQSEDGAAARHAFARRHRRPLTALAASIAATLAWVSPFALPAGQFRCGLVLLTAAGAYFWLIHRRTLPGWTRFLPKEAVVGGMFALGTTFFAGCRPGPVSAPLAVAVALFGAACFLNCALITVWECHPGDRRDPASFLNAFPAMADGGLRTVCWSLAVVAGTAGWAWRETLFAPIALAAGALASLDLWRGRLSAEALRVLVDLVLLTPCVCLGAVVVVRWAGLFFPP